MAEKRERIYKDREEGNEEITLFASFFYVENPLEIPNLSNGEVGKGKDRRGVVLTSLTPYEGPSPEGIIYVVEVKVKKDKVYLDLDLDESYPEYRETVKEDGYGTYIESLGVGRILSIRPYTYNFASRKLEAIE